MVEARIEAFEVERRRLLQEILPLTAQEQRWKSDAQSWSALEVLEHLVLTDELVLQQLPADVRVHSRLRGRAAVLLMRLVSPLGAKARAPLDAIVPRGEDSLEQLLDRWEQAHRSLWTAARARAGEAARAVLLTHPVAGPLSVLEGLDFLQEHVRHHRRQLDRIAAKRRAAGINRR